MSSKKNSISKEDAEKIVKDCYSIADFCRAVGWVPMGDNYKVFHKYEKEYGLDTTHFHGMKSNIGNKLNKKSEKSFIEYSQGESVRTSTLVKKLIEEGLKEWKCECCKNTEWMGDKIPLELHHIDGNHNNNSIENLMLLCPNCHAKTDNYRGRKNRKAAKKCSKCGAEISRWSKSGLCAKCAHVKQYKTILPSKEELYDLLTKNTFSSVGRLFGVSDNAVRKWCKKYGLSQKAKDYK